MLTRVLRFLELPGDAEAKRLQLPAPYYEARLATLAIASYEKQFGGFAPVNSDEEDRLPIVRRSLHTGILGAIVTCLEPVERRSVSKIINTALAAFVESGTHDFTGNRIQLGVLAYVQELSESSTGMVLGGVDDAVHLVQHANSLALNWPPKQ